MKSLRALALKKVAENIHICGSGMQQLPPVLQQEVLDGMEERRKEWTDASFEELLKITCDESVRDRRLIQYVVGFRTYIYLKLNPARNRRLRR